MTFKEFEAWCNQRACDGCWGMLDAMVCIDIIEKVRKQRFWKREKFWQEKYSDDVMEQIVSPIERKIEEVMENNR
ncbi:hypothetical protein [Anaerotruncus colihominis]|uniref:hypothetical protein n=1 Tax=Anaerotruncus colihominis TaxID=169435 RepID=UPI002941BC0A|nr:hypothetical protein [Anaerotruncus colihominis]